MQKQDFFFEKYLGALIWKAKKHFLNNGSGSFVMWSPAVQLSKQRNIEDFILKLDHKLYFQRIIIC